MSEMEKMSRMLYSTRCQIWLKTRRAEMVGLLLVSERASEGDLVGSGFILDLSVVAGLLDQLQVYSSMTGEMGMPTFHTPSDLNSVKNSGSD